MADAPLTERRVLTYPRDLCDPKDWLNVVQLTPFESTWKNLGLDDDDLRALEITIMIDPTRPNVMAGTGGIRKLRFAPESWGTGKSGSVRVLYAYWPDFGLVALIYAFQKSTKENITAKQKKVLKALVSEIEVYLKRGKVTPEVTHTTRGD